MTAVAEKPMQQYQTNSSALLKEAIARNEGILSSNGAFTVKTGKRTGRSPKDRFIVDDEHTHHSIDWGNVNQPINKTNFDAYGKKYRIIYKIKCIFLVIMRLALIVNINCL